MTVTFKSKPGYTLGRDNLYNTATYGKVFNPKTGKDEVTVTGRYSDISMGVLVFDGKGLLTLTDETDISKMREYIESRGDDLIVEVQDNESSI